MIGTKSNFSTAASDVDVPASAARSVSPEVPNAEVVFSTSFGPITFEIAPELRITPLPRPMMPFPPVNVPPADSWPTYVAFVTVIPGPARALARSVAVNVPVRSSVATAAEAGDADATTVTHIRATRVKRVAGRRARRERGEVTIRSFRLPGRGTYRRREA